MMHPDEDTLLKYALEVLEGSEVEDVKRHLEVCDACRDQFHTIHEQLGRMKTVSFPVETPDLPLPSTARRRTMSTVLRAAAVLLVGFILGYGTALLSEPQSSIVVSQQFRPKTPQVSVTRHTPAEQVDLSSRRSL